MQSIDAESTPSPEELQNSFFDLIQLLPDPSADPDLYIPQDDPAYKEACDELMRNRYRRESSRVYGIYCQKLDELLPSAKITDNFRSYISSIMREYFLGIPDNNRNDFVTDQVGIISDNYRESTGIFESKRGEFIERQAYKLSYSYLIQRDIDLADDFDENGSIAEEEREEMTGMLNQMQEWNTEFTQLHGYDPLLPIVNHP